MGYSKPLFCSKSVNNSASVSVALVTGGSGFLGGHLLARLLADGWHVRLLVRTPTELADEVAQRCEVVEGDLANVAALAKAVSGVQVVFHCAANVNTWDRWDAYHEANVAGVQNLLQAISMHNPGLKRLVHASTVDVYGFPVHACSEDSRTTGAGFGYGESKLLGENLVAQFCRAKNIPYTIVRPTNVIGPGSQFIERMGGELKSGLMLKVDGGRANAGLVYVDNLVNYMVWAAGAEKALGQCYNVRDPYDVTWAQFIVALQSAIHGKGWVINLPYGMAMRVSRWIQAVYGLVLPSREPVLHPLLVNLFGRTCGHDASKLRAHSGLTAGVGFEEAVARSAQWLADNGSQR